VQVGTRRLGCQANRRQPRIRGQSSGR